MTDSIHEECGVFGVYTQKRQNLAGMVYHGLFALQHRGQESCGIVTCDDGIFTSHKDLGLVSEVFTQEELAKLPDATMAIGHVRYGTTGATNRKNCQPIEVNHQKGKMAIAHNGNISNAYELRTKLELSGAIFHTTSDTEIIAYIITRERLKTASIEEAVANAVKELDGAFSLVVMSATKMVAVRDPHGFRPLCFGFTEDGTYVVASESCALSVVGANFVRDIKPGEMIVFDETGMASNKVNCESKPKKTCIFEYIYFARPDSVIDGHSVHMARLKAGELLAQEDKEKALMAGKDRFEADVVIGVPDSGLDAALGYAQEAGIPYGIGFIKNRYIGRTFIAPGQKNRVDKVRIKLNAIKETVAGKRVVLIDDSIVRGTTSGQIVKLIREAGAKEIHVRISSPPFLNPCYYGTDIDSKENLIACHHSIDEIAEIIGADSLAYLPMEDLPKLINDASICNACFSGEYPTKVPERTEKDRFEMPLSMKKGGK